jgi:hypothetical protein
MKTYYMVEYRENADDPWTSVDEFSSLGEAMGCATSEALCHVNLEHRIVRWNAEEVLTIPRLEEHV